MKYIKKLENFLNLLNPDEDSLVSAITDNKLSKVKKCIQNNVNVNAADNFKRTPLHFAVSQPGQIEIVKELINAGSNLNAINYWNQTPLMIAAQYHSLFEYVILLIESGADWNIINPDDGNDFLDILSGENINYLIQKYPKEYEEYIIKKKTNKYNL
jgi:ankyrin repeat protein